MSIKLEGNVFDKIRKGKRMKLFNLVKDYVVKCLIHVQYKGKLALHKSYNKLAIRGVKINDKTKE